MKAFRCADMKACLGFLHPLSKRSYQHSIRALSFDEPLYICRSALYRLYDCLFGGSEPVQSSGIRSSGLQRSGFGSVGCRGLRI